MNVPNEPIPWGLDSGTLERVRALVQDTAGIVISDSKAAMVRARLSKRVNATGFTSAAAYLDHVQGADCGDELTRLISAMTTNVTQFCREAYHFDALVSELVPAWTARAGTRSVWSAGCASGQEAYSIAMALQEAGLGRDRVRILATDIDRTVLGRAAAGIYTSKEVASIPRPLLERYFLRVGFDWHVGSDLRRLVTFRALNLVGTWPFKGRFDAIFCRNVAIYFDAPTQQALWRRLIGALRPRGRLFVGHSERLPESLLGQSISYLGQTMYAKSAAADDQARW